MAIILNLETATTNCSVSVAQDGKLLSLIEENSANYSHSEQLHKFINIALADANIERTELDAVAVSKGPGSYTGLRIGVSAAKGLCYALEIPLISINTLRSLAHTLAIEKGYIVPMLDARRMEVYAAVYDHQYLEIKPTWAEIIQADSFSAYKDSGGVTFIGNGAEKCKSVLTGQNFVFDSSKLPSAREMAQLSFQKYKLNDFEDVAYFEPFYLKDFITTKPK